METVELICTRSRLGDALTQISQLTGLSIDQVKEILGQATGLTAEQLSLILHMKQEGHSLEQISQEVQVALEVLNQFLPQNSQKTDKTSVTEPAESNPILFDWSNVEDYKEPSESHPHFIYCCRYGSGQLLRTNLLTGEQSCHQVPTDQFKFGCRWNELPGGGLLVTGGWSGSSSVRETVKIDTLKEFAVISLSPMRTARCSHTAVYHSQYLYVLGGFRDERRCVGECERYAESQWQMLPALLVPCAAMSAVELDSSLYLLGGKTDRGDLDTVQKLRLDSLTWELMHLRLPQACDVFPCFKTDTKVYLLIKETLYTFTDLEVKTVKTVRKGIRCYTSYYSKGTLYYSWDGAIKTLHLNKLTI
jgi:hypothetical protein